MSLFNLQTCETRTWLDVLGEELLIAVADAKGAVCGEGTQLFEKIGLNIVPCDFFNDEVYKLIQSGDQIAVTNLILLSTGLPPYTPKLLKDGYSSLDEEEKKEVDDWAVRTGTLAGVTVQQQAITAINERISPPSTETLKTLITRLNAVNRLIGKVLDKSNKVASGVEKTALTVNTIDAAITAVDLLVPVADAALVSSAATPTGIAATFARLIQKLEKYADKYRADVRGPSNRYGEKGLVDMVCRISKVVLFAQVTLGGLQAFVQVITSILEGLVQEQIALEATTPVEINNTILQASQGFVLDSSNNTYKGYRIEIKTDPDSPAVAPRRYAVAIDRYGVVVLEGRPSFSSSTEVLVDEIKYQIDRLGR